MTETKQEESPKKRRGFFDIPDELKEEITGKIRPVSVNQEYKRLLEVMQYQWGKFALAYKEYLKSNGVMTGYRDIASQVAVYGSILAKLGIGNDEAMTNVTKDAVLNYLEANLSDVAEA